MLAWWAAGNLGGERPTPAQRGNSYPLIEKSNCRWASGACDLVNGDFTLELSIADDAVQTLRVQASHALESLLVSVGADQNTDPVPMQLSVEPADGRLWQLALSQSPSPGDRIRVAAVAGGSSWYGEAGVDFMQANPLLQ